MSGMIGGFANAPGKYYEGKVQHDIQKFNAAIYAANARATEAKTKYELIKGGRELKGVTGTQRAMFAAAGVETEGTPLAIMAETYARGAEKARLTRYAGDVEAAEWMNRARMARFQGKVAFKAGQMGAISSAIGGAASGGESAYGMFG